MSAGSRALRPKPEPPAQSYRSHVNRRTLDVAVPMVYAIAIVAAVFLGSGPVVTGVAVVGAMLVGLYFAALRRNLTP
jgi:hypothetical protein